MTSQDTSSSRKAVPYGNLPWLIGGIFLVVYLVTLSRGAGLAGIPIISTVTGWDWQPLLHYPLYYLVSLPIRILPVSLEPLALNALSAMLAAGTLALIARSVQILPQDRTRDQRERERGSHGYLTGSSAWLPPVAAAAMCGLQLLFWQNATNASVDMLNLFVLAWIIRDLLEYRIDNKGCRLTRVALIYGLGVTSNPALIALFPVTLGAIIWIMGRSFFRSPLILKLFVAGLAGLLLYLLLPALAVSSGKMDITFWEALKENMGTQKGILQRGFNNRLFPMVMSLGSLFPLVLIGVRWPSSFGDTSAAGAFLTRMMFRVLTVLFIAGSLTMNFQLAHAVRAREETGISFHSLYLISALVLGYSLGYLLVVFGKKPGREWQKSGPLGELLNKALVGVAWLVLPLVVVGLPVENYRKVHDLNVSPLYTVAAQMAADLPETPAVVLADDNVLLSLVADQLNRAGRTEHMLLHTASLTFPGYHQLLNKRTDGAWPTVPQQFVHEKRVVDPYIVKTVADAATNRAVVYLQPSFGYYFEWFYPVESKSLYGLNRYTNTEIQAPLPDAAAMQAQGKFLQTVWDETLADVQSKLDAGRASVADDYLAQVESRVFNHWGSRLQQAGKFQEATPWFERAANLFTNNVSALINLEYNRHRLSGTTNTFALSESTLAVWKRYRDNIQAALSYGGPIDEPGFCVGLGNLFSTTGLQRQSAQQFLRALTLTPNNQYARAQLARTFIQAQAPDRALEVLSEIRKLTTDSGLNDYAMADLSLIEATALLAKGKTAEANAILDTLTQKHGEDPVVVEAVAQLYLGMAQLQKDFLPRAEAAAQKFAALSPTNQQAQANLGLLAMLKEDWVSADAVFSSLLENDPEMVTARINRAIANLRRGDLARSLEDYKLLEEKEPDAYRIQFGLGEIAEKQGRDSDAVKHFRSYLDHAPKTFAEYTNVLERVQKLEHR